MNSPNLFGGSQSLHDSNRSYDSSRSSLSLNSSSSSFTNSPSPWRQRKMLKKQTRRVSTAGVTFAPLQEQTFDILDRSDFSSEEIEACWWAPKELQMIRESKHNRFDGDDGIDMPMEEDGCQSSQQYVQYMLSQQSELRRLGIDDPSGLSIISRSISKQSRKYAERRAIRHAEYVREVEFSGVP